MDVRSCIDDLAQARQRPLESLLRANKLSSSSRETTREHCRTYGVMNDRSPPIIDAVTLHEVHVGSPVDQEVRNVEAARLECNLQRRLAVVLLGRLPGHGSHELRVLVEELANSVEVPVSDGLEERFHWGIVLRRPTNGQHSRRNRWNLGSLLFRRHLGGIGG